MRFLLGLWLFSHAALYAQTDSVSLDPKKIRNTWEGWGTSLAWWGVGAGGSAYQDTLADAVFTLKTTQVMGADIKGLGLNIVRYNVGGGGQPGDIENLNERRPNELLWFKDVDGYWIDWNSKATDSPSWDWSRDANQRSMLQAAVLRGVDRLEFFANAPMWWMMDSKSSAGGRLQSWNRKDFAHYLASVVEVAQQNWQVKVTSISPFNEPSATWWNWPKNQEGCTIPMNEQLEIIKHLDEALQNRGLSDVQIAASDENTMKEAKASIDYFDQKKIGQLVDKVNVHSYNGLAPWRDNQQRLALKKSVKDRPIWASEYGDNDGSGAELAQTIMEDLHYLTPTAWIYWQIIEPWSAWGAINAATDRLPTDPLRAEPSWVYLKFHIFGHFTRYIRPGMKILDHKEPNLIIAYDPASDNYAGVFLNRGPARTLTLSGGNEGRTLELMRSKFDGSKVWERSTGQIGSDLKLEAGVDEILSFQF